MRWGSTGKHLLSNAALSTARGTCQTCKVVHLVLHRSSRVLHHDLLAVPLFHVLLMVPSVVPLAVPQLHLPLWHDLLVVPLVRECAQSEHMLELVKNQCDQKEHRRNKFLENECAQNEHLLN